ncbi:MAG: hypothetical protein FWE33_04230 [Defluviitaleaceae bacterium]|nr:hypothetical protein [Defluviitaleaceae bacterium]
MVYKYEYLKHIEEDLPNIDYKEHDGNLVLFGAGINGAIVARLLEKQGVRFLCFADSDHRKWGTDYLGYTVLSPEQMKQMHPNATILITPYTVSAAYKQIKKMGYDNIITPLSLILEFDTNDVMEALPDDFSQNRLFASMNYYMRKLISFYDIDFKRIVLMITERCTLRCKECQSLMPHFENPKDIEWDVIKKSLERLLSVSRFEGVYMEGGEIFLHPNIADILELLIESPNMYSVTPITNGTLIPNERTLKALEHPKVFVRISNYREHSKNMQNLIKVFEERGIKHYVYNYQWHKLSEIRLYERTDEELQVMLENCCTGDGAPPVKGGRIYRCPFAANAESLGIVPKREGDSFNIMAEPFNPTEFKENLDKFFKSRNVLEACKYCAGRNYAGERTIAGEQLVGKAPELPKFS